MHIKNRWLVSGLCFILLCSSLILLLVLNRQKKGEESVRIIYIPKVDDNSNDFWCAVKAGAEMAVRDYEVDFKMMAPQDEGDIEGQIQYIYDAIEQKPDAIVVAPSSYTETVKAVEAVKKSGIKLILIDSEVKSQVQDCLISTNNYLAGKKIAGYLKDTLRADSRILIVSHVKNTSTALERERGVREGLGEWQSQITDVLYTDSDYEKAYRMTASYLKEHQEVNIVIGLNEYSAVGAARAIAELEQSREIQAVGFDNSVEEIKLLEKGDFGAIVIQKAFNMGYIGIESAVKLSLGEAVLPKIDSGSELITKENMYTEENQKLLFPFIE